MTGEEMRVLILHKIMDKLQDAQKASTLEPDGIYYTEQVTNEARIATLEEVVTLVDGLRQNYKISYLTENCYEVFVAAVTANGLLTLTDDPSLAGLFQDQDLHLVKQAASRLQLPSLNAKVVSPSTV